MTPIQRSTVETLQAEGFTNTRHHKDMVLMSRGADHRFVRADGSQMRANNLERGCEMSEFVEVKTEELIGAALDWAVAKVEGFEYRHDGIKCRTRITRRQWHHYTKPNFMPSADWSQGGPLISKYHLDLVYDGDHLAYAYVCKESGDREYQPESYGPNHLVAACRAIVSFKLGDTVSIPAELVKP